MSGDSNVKGLIWNHQTSVVKQGWKSYLIFERVTQILFKLEEGPRKLLMILPLVPPVGIEHEGAISTVVRVQEKTENHTNQLNAVSP